MKVLHASGFSLKAKGAFVHGVPPKLSNGLTRNGHHVVNFSDRDVARSASFLGHRKFGIGAANGRLRALCRDFGPDLLLLTNANVIRPETLADIRRDRPSLRIVQVNVDPLFEADNVQRIEANLGVVDATLVTTAGNALAQLVRPGKLLGFMPNPVDFSIESGRNHERDDLPFDVFFACGAEHQTRAIGGETLTPHALIRRISDAQPSLTFKLAGLHGSPHLHGESFQQAMESAAMGINMSRRNDYYLYTSDRLAQMIGNGQTVLVDRATGYDLLFSEEEFAFFNTIDEMIGRLAHFKQCPEERRKIGAVARARYHDLFNERRIARYVVDVALEQLKEDDYPWPTLHAS